MVEIRGTRIKLTRGDTLYLTAQLFNADGTKYVPQQGDLTYFRMKKRYSDTEDVIYKVFDNTTMQIRLDPQDTEGLIVDYEYPYNIRTIRGENEVATPILGVFVPTQEVG